MHAGSKALCGELQKCKRGMRCGGKTPAIELMISVRELREQRKSECNGNKTQICQAENFQLTEQRWDGIWSFCAWVRSEKNAQLHLVKINDLLPHGANGRTDKRTKWYQAGLQTLSNLKHTQASNIMSPHTGAKAFGRISPGDIK